MNRVFATGVLILAVAGVASCTKAGAQTPAAQHPVAAASVSPPAVTASPTVSNLNDASLPLDRYTTTVDEWIELDYASKLLSYDCMKRFGYTLNPGGRLKLTEFRDRSNRMGLVDEAQAARAGYHVDPATAGDRSSHDTGPKLTDEQEVAMSGERNGKPATDVPAGGCAGEGYRKIGWNTTDDMWLQELDNEAASRTLADKNALKVMADWSACMQKSGYRYAKPDDASQDPRWWKGSDDDPATKAEKNTAVADVRCKKKVNWVGQMTAILTAYQQQLVETNLERLESVHGQVQDALKKAAAVLSGR